MTPRDLFGEMHWSRVLALSCAGVLAALMLWGWDDLAPLFLVPLLIGLAVGCCSRTRAEALAAGLVSGVLGTSAAVWVYEPNRRWALVLAMPQSLNQDVIAATYTVWAKRVWQNDAPVSAYFAHTSHLPMLAAGSLLLPLFALAARELADRGPTQSLSRLIPWLVSILAAVCLVWTMSPTVIALGWPAALDHAWTPGTYASDMFDNLRTLQIMKADGKGYYAASTESAGGDTRTGPGILAAGGKWPSGSASMIRQPAMFYLWRLITLDAPVSTIGWVSLAIAALMMPLSYWGLRNAVGHRALFVGFALFPGLALWSSTPGSLQPEWWALLFLFAAFFMLVRGKALLSLAPALAAVLIRETTGTWLLCALLVFVFLGLNDRRWFRVALLPAGLLACAVVAFWLHTSAGSAFFAHPANGSALASYLGQRHSRTFADRTLAPLSYLMLPYGLAAFSPVWLVPLGIVGFWVGLARTPVARLVSTLYVSAMVAFFVVFGATSTYWGQILNPFIVVGVMLLVVSADRLGSSAAWRFSWPSETELTWPAPPRPSTDARPQPRRRAARHG